MTFRTTSVSQHVFLRGFLSVCTLAAGSRMWRGTQSSDITMGCLDSGRIPSLLKSRLSSQRLWMSVHIGRPTLTLEGSEEPGFRVDAGSCTDTEEDMGQVHTKILLSTMLGKSYHLFLWQKITGMWLTSIVNSLEQSLPDIVQRDFPGTLFKTLVCFNKSGASPSSALFCFSVPGVVPSWCLLCASQELGCMATCPARASPFLTSFQVSEMLQVCGSLWEEEWHSQCVVNITRPNILQSFSEHSCSIFRNT